MPARKLVGGNWTKQLHLYIKVAFSNKIYEYFMVIGEIIDYVAMENFRINVGVFSILVTLFLKQSTI